MAVNCPYCKKEIVPGEIRCPSCGTTYGLDTLILLKNLAKQVVMEYPDEHRKYDRVPKNFKVVYQTPETLVKFYLFNIGQGGVHIQTDNPLKRGEKFVLTILLPDGGEELEVFCEVVWSRKEERVTSKGKYPQGMGIKFLNLSPENKERIIRNLHQATT